MIDAKCLMGFGKPLLESLWLIQTNFSSIKRVIWHITRRIQWNLFETTTQNCTKNSLKEKNIQNERWSCCPQTIMLLHLVTWNLVFMGRGLLKEGAFWRGFTQYQDSVNGSTKSPNTLWKKPSCWLILLYQFSQNYWHESLLNTSVSWEMIISITMGMIQNGCYYYMSIVGLHYWSYTY